MVSLGALQKGTLVSSINKGLIRYILEEENENAISGRHPITLSNTSYKIVVKTLAIRIRPILYGIVYLTNNVHGRHIFLTILNEPNNYVKMLCW